MSAIAIPASSAGRILLAVDRERRTLRIGQTAKRPVPSMVGGGTYVLAPSDAASAAAASQSATAKYGSQCAARARRPEAPSFRRSAARPTSSVYVMPPPVPVFAFQPKSAV
ncbi:MAG: hypothetical protein IPL89_07480 [Acidobacteria bacterium]|nr:hypothetical protein [Acidobacteriota bacterium]